MAQVPFPKPQQQHMGGGRGGGEQAERSASRQPRISGDTRTNASARMQEAWEHWHTGDRTSSTLQGTSTVRWGAWHRAA